MPTSNNPFKPGELARVKRGDVWLPGVVTSIRLSTVFVQLADSGKIVHDHYNDVSRNVPAGCCRTCGSVVQATDPRCGCDAESREGQRMR